MRSTALIADPLYGSWEMEDVLAELILSQPVQRLKRIHQGGAGYLVNPIWNVTRYEHSVGVMLLLRKLGADLEEQIMGLLHDVSHAAFSHVADLIFFGEQEEHHEQLCSRVIWDSVIPDILMRYGIDMGRLLEKECPLLNRPLPGLSADRIDRTLRNMFNCGKTSKREVEDFLQSLRVQDDVICVANLLQAEWFVQLYYQEVIGMFLDPLNLYGDEVLAQAIRLSLEKGVLTPADLLSDDETVFFQMAKCGDGEVVELVSRIHPRVRVTESKTGYHFHRKGKPRLINPEILTEDGRRVRASEVSVQVKRLTDQAQHRFRTGTFVKVLDW